MKFIYLLITALFIFSACNKTDIDANQSGSIEFSVDTLHFDTLINGLESPVKTLKVFNRSNEDIVFSSIEINSNSFEGFKLQSNGQTGQLIKEIYLPALDSIYLFVTLLPNQDISNETYEINNEIKLKWNSQEKTVPIQAFAIPVTPLKDLVLEDEFTFETNRSYFIQGQIEVPTNKHLIIPEGVKIFAYPNSKFLIKGSIEINGTPQNRVLFTSYRIDQPIEGSWEGLQFIANGQSHNLKNVTIQYAKQGIHYFSDEIQSDQINLEGVKVEQSSGIGLSFMNISVNIKNSLIANNSTNLRIIGGGQYNFIHVTFASYSSMSRLHLSPSVTIKDQTEEGISFPLKVHFLNTIIWGDLAEEIAHESSHEDSETIIENSIYKSTQTQSFIQFLESYNLDPLFEEIDISKKIYNFKLSASSPAIDQGKTTLIQEDLLGNFREDGFPDLGCYEYNQQN